MNTMRITITIALLMIFQLNIYSQHIVSISPQSSVSGQILDVTIIGANTHFNQGIGTYIDFEFSQGSPTTVINSYSIINDNKILANISVPDGTYTKNYDVYISNTPDGNLLLQDGFYVFGDPLPVISNITPNTGNAGETLDVAISGTNTHFTQGSATTIDFEFSQGIPATVVNSYSLINDELITANITIPTNTFTGDYDAYIYSDIDGKICLDNGFYVKGVEPPKIKSINPSSANIDETLDVTILGANTRFTQGSSTIIDFEFSQGSPTTVINHHSIINDSTISVNISTPSDLYTDDYDVFVSNLIDGNLVLEDGFHINGITPPSLVSISPSDVHTRHIDVMITGANTHFTQASTTVIDFEFSQGDPSAVVSSQKINSDNSISAEITIPYNTVTDMYDVYLYNHIDGGLVLTNGIHVTQVLKPVLVSLSPSLFQPGETMDVTVSAENTHFNECSEITIDFNIDDGNTDNIINSYTILGNKSISINITIPENTADGLYDLNVYNNLDGKLTLTDALEVYTQQTPTIVSVSPSSGVPGQTLDITISGENTHFSDNNETLVDFEFRRENSNTVVNSQSISSNTSMNVNLTIPENTTEGNYTIYLSNKDDGLLILNNGFYVGYTSNEVIFQNGGFSIHPNPASHILFIETKNEKQSIQAISIYDINGQLVSNSNYSENKIELDIRGLVNGIYLIEIKTDKNTFVQRFIKE